MNAFMISKALSGPPNPASASATIGANQSRLAPPSACSIWSARVNALLIRRQSSGPAFAGYRLWIGIDVTRGIGVGGNLPAGEINRVESGSNHLHRLIAGHRTETGNVGLGMQQLPQTIGPMLGKSVVHLQRTAQTQHVSR